MSIQEIVSVSEYDVVQGFNNEDLSFGQILKELADNHKKGDIGMLIDNVADECGSAVADLTRTFLIGILALRNTTADF